MLLKLLVLCATVEIVKSKIKLDFNIDKDGDVSIDYLGKEVISPVDYDHLKIFNVKESDLKSAIDKYIGKSPDKVSIKDPPSWADSCNYEGESLSTIISIQSATVRGITKQPVTVTSRDYENTATIPITVNGGITYTVENKMTTNWSHQTRYSSSANIGFDVNVNFFVTASLTGNSSASFISDWRVSEEKSVRETIGTNTGFETVLQPGQAVTAVLSVITGHLEIDVVYKVQLDGNVRWYYSSKYQDYNCWRRPVHTIFSAGGLNTETTVTETIKYVYHTDMSLKVFDKATGLLL